MGRADIKIFVMLIFQLVGMFWWINEGASIVLDYPPISGFYDQLRVHEAFSLESALLLLFMASIILIPIALWFLVCLAALDRGFFSHLFNARTLMVIALLPVIFVCAITALFMLRIITSLVFWAAVIFGVLYVVFGLFAAAAKTIFKIRKA